MFTKTIECLKHYNEIHEKAIGYTEEEEEFIINFSIYLAHALIKDVGFYDDARDELAKVANIINDVCGY